MRLFEHPDFHTLIVAAAEQLGMPPHFVEKDYYVTEALRIAQQKLADRVTFKDGTSLSKGWGLISRFSEDIDLFVNPRADPIFANSRAIDRRRQAGRLRRGPRRHLGLGRFRAVGRGRRDEPERGSEATTRGWRRGRR
jgi:hypothetical protein